MPNLEQVVLVTKVFPRTLGSATVPLERDLARLTMGGKWRTPTSGECQELIDNTSQTLRYKLNGVSGCLFTSKVDSEKSIFIPRIKMSNGNYNIRIWTSTRGMSGGAYNGYFVHGTKFNGVEGIQVLLVGSTSCMNIRAVFKP